MFTGRPFFLNVNNIKNADMIKLLISITLFICFSVSELFAGENIIRIDTKADMGSMNNKVFGNNFIAYDPKTFEYKRKINYYGYSDFGSAIWDPDRKNTIPAVIELARKIKINMLRFPGGEGANRYNWKNSVGGNRVHFLYGIDEFLESCYKIGAEPIYTLGYYVETEQDTIELITYLNTKSKHLKYIEIGNELYYAKRHGLSPEEYAVKYLQYYNAVKNTDAGVNVGVVLDNSLWDERVLSVIKDKFDFGIIHIYPKTRFINRSANEIFRDVLGKVIMDVEKRIKAYGMFFQRTVGKNRKLAVTEYNLGLRQEKPVPYRHSLGAALTNAELIRLFSYPSNNILLANYWQFCNSYWGMVANGFDGTEKTLNNPYYKRPNYYVFELYADHFGDILLKSDLKCSFYENNGQNIPYLSINSSKSGDGKKIYLMVINKNMDTPETAVIELKNFSPAREGNAWVLNGPSVDATNEINHDNVKVAHKAFTVSGSKFEYTFEPHSLTAIEIDRVK